MVPLRAAAVVVTAAAAVAAVAVVLARGGSPPAVAPTAPVLVRTSLGSGSAAFGEALDARVVVVMDRDAVRTQTLRIVDDLAPLTVLSAPSTTRTTSGRLETVTTTQRVACLTAACLGDTVHPAAVKVTVDGRTVQTRWHRLRIRSLVGASTSTHLVADATPPAPSYSTSPGTLATVLQVVGGLAAAGALALLALELLARRRRRVVAVDELTRALRLVRESEEREVPDRRRALGLLARLAGDRGARDLAWSAPSPEPPAIEDVLERHA